MKKLVLTSAIALALTGAAFAQGTVNWVTLSPAALTFTTNTTTSSYLSSSGVGSLQNGTTGLTTAVAGSFYYELLYNTAGTAQSAPTTLAGLQGWADAGVEAENNAGSAGKTTTINSSTDATVPFTGTESIMLVGWSANLGTTWSAALSALENKTWSGVALFGETSTGYIAPFAAGTSPGATLFGPSTGEIDSLNTPLYEVATPEPTTLALSALGGLSLLAFRRKKA